MIKKGIIIFVSLCSVAFAQNADLNRTLFSIDGDNVSVKEFIRVYTKNNINNQADFSKNSLDEYLSLYKNFRLKVKEAEALGMDTAKAFKSELASYRNQLTQTYLTDREVTENLAKEAYNRMQEEINVSHILIFWPNAKPTKADSIKVLNEIAKIKSEAEKTSFDSQILKYNKQVGAKYPGNKQKYEGGKLGYVTVFQTVYPFENAMYNTKAGNISEPVATQFGYHIVYVKDKRPARGKMETAHLLVKSKTSDSRENQKIAKDKVFQIYKEIKSGTKDFESAVKEYSEDKKTKFQAGKLPALSGSEMLEPFSDAVFALKKDGEITVPVQTRLGWHIVKRIKKDEIPEYDFAKNDIDKKVKKDSRSNVANEMMIADTKSKFGFSENAYAKDDLFRALENAKGKINNQQLNVYTKELFRIGSKSVSQNDFLNFSTLRRSRKQSSAEEKYEIFKKQIITKYREDHLEEISEDFKNLMQEYHDGILLFELTNKEVWNKAVEDTAGLKKFFNNNRDKYIWKKRVSYTTYTAKDAKTASKLKKFLVKGKSNEFILNKMNKKEEVLTSKESKEEKGTSDFVNGLNWTNASISEEKNLDGSVKLTYVNEIIAPRKKELKETRGYVISDYQDFLEAQWIENLSVKFPIKIDNQVFKSLIK